MRYVTWGGQLAVYDVSAGIDGAVTRVKRRVIEGREHMAAIAKLVELEAFESCIRRWRFERLGEYTVSLIGGTALDKGWVIDVRTDSRRFRLRVPVQRPTD
jgi:hypothetical protein